MVAGAFTHGTFAYTQVTSDRYATPLPSPLTIATPYAPHYNEASTLLPTHLTFTTYSLSPNATRTHDGKYGQNAYAALWSNYTYSEALPFTTTVSATPVPTGELVFPPALSNAPQVNQNASKFPSDFIWGVAGSAWQMEGGSQLEGRGPATFDFINSGPNVVTDLDYPATGDDAVVANMHYLLYEEDIARLAAIGVPNFSFSISWTRVVPFGHAGSPVNTQALDHYEDVINTCLKYGVTPIVTLVHEDAPAGFHAADATFRADFLYYAKIVMARYADRVPMWITFNELNVGFPYTYSAFTNILLQHADVYHWYKNVLKGTGRITIKLVNLFAVPRDLTNPDDVATAVRYQEFLLGIMSNPMFLGQQYPASALSTSELGLKPLTDNEISYIHGTSDVYAINPYSAQFVSAPSNGLGTCASSSSDPLWPTCANTTHTQLNGWALGAHGHDEHCYIAPQYVRQQLGYIWNTYRPSAIIITEFGFTVYDEALRTLEDQRYDLERSLYFQDFLNEVLKSVNEDGVNVIGALAWSFADDNEFGSYTSHYGMQTVDRRDGRLRRRYKRSLFDFVDFFHQHVASG
ncbi:unnamed protein product [Discula destructiva]